MAFSPPSSKPPLFDIDQQIVDLMAEDHKKWLIPFTEAEQREQQRQQAELANRIAAMQNQQALEAARHPAAQAQHGLGPLAFPINPSPPPHPATAPNPSHMMHARARALLLDRLGGISGPYQVPNGDFLMCHVHEGIVYIFFVFDRHEGATKESTDMFPSDRLIAQLRMALIV